MNVQFFGPFRWDSKEAHFGTFSVQIPRNINYIMCSTFDYVQSFAQTFIAHLFFVLWWEHVWDATAALQHMEDVAAATSSCNDGLLYLINFALGGISQVHGF